MLKAITMQGIIEASKDDNGKPDPYKAAGIAAGIGNFSFEDQMLLGGMLGSRVHLMMTMMTMMSGSEYLLS